jgi:hypothetical protein
MTRLTSKDPSAIDAGFIFSEQKPYPPKQKAEIMRKPSKTRTSKPSLKAIEAGARAMAPSARLHLKTWNGRNVTAAEWELIERRVNTAKKIQRDGSDELIEAVQGGVASVSAAAEVAALPKNSGRL